MTSEQLPPLASSSSSSLPTTTASYTRYEVVPSSYATTHAIRTTSSSSKVLTVDLPSPDSGIGADAVTPRQDHHPPTALHQVFFPSYQFFQFSYNYSCIYCLFFWQLHISLKCEIQSICRQISQKFSKQKDDNTY